jgi:ABC-type multidrug transport system fused ATPase/permease subunit
VNTFIVVNTFNTPMKVIELIKRKPRESPAGDYIPDSGALVGSLALQGVVFAYPGRPTQLVLNGLSLAVNPGVCVWH